MTGLATAVSNVFTVLARTCNQNYKGCGAVHCERESWKGWM